VSIWSLNERQIVARCPGHDSWVTAVAFDPWRCDDKTYRFGTVGEDCKLLLWDFNVGMLHRPKGVSGHVKAHSMRSDPWQTVGRNRGSVSTQSISLARHRTESASVVNRVRSDSNRTQSMHQPELDEDAEFINHAVEPRSRTAQLPPILSRKVDEHSLTGLAFEQDCIITSCQEGTIMYTWHG
jgi:catabolite repression protein CreC